VKQLIKAATPFARAVAVLPDQEQQFLYVGDGAAVDIVDRKSLELIGEIKPPGIVSSHLITSDPKGNIYVAGTTMGAWINTKPTVPIGPPRSHSPRWKDRSPPQ
jgi:hypothetical protein